MQVQKKAFIIVGLIAILFVLSLLIILRLVYTDKEYTGANNTPINSNVINVHGSIAFKNVEDLILESEVIVKGKVYNILPSKWRFDNKEKDGYGNPLQTDILVDIDKIFKGMPYNDKHISVRVYQGSTDSVVVISDGYPEFTIGEDVILFLSKDDGPLANLQENYYVLTGMRQGKFMLDKNDTSKNKYITDKIYSEEKINLNTFETEIRSLLEKERTNPRKRLTKEEIREQNKKIFGE